MSLIRARFTGDGLAAVLRPAPPLPAFAISPFSVLVRFVPAYEKINQKDWQKKKWIGGGVTSARGVSLKKRHLDEGAARPNQSCIFPSR